MANLVDSIKCAALNAVESSKPAAILFGEVIDTAPLKIKVEQKMTLEEPQLLLTEMFTKDKTLVIGDNVYLIRVQGGQKFIIGDRIP